MTDRPRAPSEFQIATLADIHLGYWTPGFRPATVRALEERGLIRALADGGPEVTPEGWEAIEEADIGLWREGVVTRAEQERQAARERAYREWAGSQPEAPKRTAMVTIEQYFPASFIEEMIAEGRLPSRGRERETPTGNIVSFEAARLARDGRHGAGSDRGPAA